MCRELNALGLPDPVFDNNTFILKTTIRSAAYEKLPVGEKEVGHSIQKLPIENKEVGHSNKNVAIEQQEVGHSKENLTVEMIALVDIIKLCDKNHYNRATIHNIEKLYEDIELNQIFSTGYIYKTLACARTTAKNLMSKLREMDIIVPVKGKGKGKYRFKYKSEM